MDSSLASSLFDLDGKIACVTGASAGLGHRAADILLRAGCRVVGVARREDKLADWSNAQIEERVREIFLYAAN